MRSFVAYTLARLGLFLGAFGVLWAVGQLFWARTTANLLWMVLVALVVSALASLVLLRGLRDALARDIAARAERMSGRLEAARTKEDTDD
ncbi:MAG: DUF4229 domain-containing protein [Nocardioidaceae bacterium]|nr:DUF4229 domain-containing protein [Nocardioidaceae bacterium]MDQ3166688.1 DUF4229 domain-containing protein [Actinomycetota bacterium]